jgi:uncharacterized protein (DUF362 family)
MAQSKKTSYFNRREFLRMAAALSSIGALTAFLDACSRVGLEIPDVSTPAGFDVQTTATNTDQLTSTPTQQQLEQQEPTQTFTAEPTKEKIETMAKIAFVKTVDRLEGVRKAIQLLGINPVSNKNVFLKPNYNSAHPTPGSTHPEVLRALVVQLQEMGANNITVGDRSGMGDTRTVMDQLGVFAMAQELGFETLVFDELTHEQWQKYQPAGSHWKNGFLFAKPCLDSDVVVQTCCLKTHQYGGIFTMSLKNSVGMVAKNDLVSGYDYMRELHTSEHQRKMIAEINTVYSPALIVVDGVEAFRNGGPHVGERVPSELVLAGTDRVAIDAVGVAVLQYFDALKDKPAFEQEQIARAVELGLGVDGADKIELITGDAPSAEYAQQINALLISG